MASKDDDELAKEKDLKFKLWLQNKALKDKAFEVLLYSPNVSSWLTLCNIDSYL